jgi:hypothetical protein
LQEPLLHCPLLLVPHVGWLVRTLLPWPLLQDYWQLQVRQFVPPAVSRVRVQALLLLRVAGHLQMLLQRLLLRG